MQRWPRGAAVERFDIALQEVLDNIQDVNTMPKKKRTITLKVEIEPDEQRGIGKVVVACESKLAPVKPFGTHIYMGRDKAGKGVATEMNPQGSLFDQEKPEKTTEKAVENAENVYKIHK